MGKYEYVMGRVGLTRNTFYPSFEKGYVKLSVAYDYKGTILCQKEYLCSI